MKPARNDRCPCGSGKKYKHCCEATAGPMSRFKSLALIAGVVITVGAVWIGKPFFSGDAGQGDFARPQGEAPPGKVWSAEHGHYHDASPGQPLPVSGQAATPQPPGEPPPGKVWSAEHGHYHDAPLDPSPADFGQTDTLPAPGRAPR